MSSYGPASLDRLETCCNELVAVCKMVIPVYDHTILWGARGRADQNEAYRLGNSTKMWPHSLHNVEPPDLSDAVDMAPWFLALPHIRWDHEREFIYLAGHMMQAAAALGVNLRWGGDWDRDKDLYDRNKPFDLGHFERVD